MAENDDGQEKTEDPTPKRIDDSRKKGMIPQSRELGSIGILFAGFLFIYFGLKALFGGILDLMRYVFAGLDRPMTRFTINEVMITSWESVGMLLAALLLLLTVVGFAIAVLQVGWTPNEEALTLNLERLNPLPGIKRMFSMEAMIELAKSMFKLLIVGYLGYQVFRDAFQEVVTMPRAGMMSSFGIMGELLYLFTLRSLLWLSIIAILDLLWQRYSTFEKMKMTKQEVKEEAKDREGNPQVKGQLRRLARKRLQEIGLANVAKADVVVTNPDHFAIALEYKSGKMHAPRVVARGQDRMAELIKAEARKRGIPRVENRILARTLYKLTQVGDEVPPQLYQAVAEVLAFVYRLRHQSAV